MKYSLKMNRTYTVEEDPLKLVQNCYQMVLDDDLTDVTLVTGDEKTFRAHKVILSAASPILKRMLRKNVNAIYMWNINYSTMKALIKYIYCGKVALEKEDIEMFDNVSQKLQIYSLQNENSKSEVNVLNEPEFLDEAGRVDVLEENEEASDTDNIAEENSIEENEESSNENQEQVGDTVDEENEESSN